MNKFIMAFLIVSFAVIGRGVAEKSADGYDRTNIQSVVTIENDVIMDNTLPRYGTVCADVKVYGQPAEDNDPLYEIKAGEVVRLREQSHGNGRKWVMIAPANYIRLTDLCAR